jgi:hypothetical protein
LFEHGLFGVPLDSFSDHVLASTRNRDAEQESNEQAGERRFARDRRNRRERPARLSRFLDRRGKTIDRCMQAPRDFTDRAGYIRRCIDGAFGHAGLGIGLRYLRAQARPPGPMMEAGTFGYPRERSF